MISDFLNEIIQQERNYEDKIFKKEILSHSSWAGDNKVKYIRATNIMRPLEPTGHNKFRIRTLNYVEIYEFKPENLDGFVRVSDEEFKLLVKYAKEEKSLTKKERENFKFKIWCI